MAPSGGTITFDISLTSGRGSANGIGAIRNDGTTESGGTIGGGGVRASMNTHCP